MQNYIVTINFCISHVKQQETEAFNSISFEEHAMLNCGKVSIYIYEKVNKSFHYKGKKKSSLYTQVHTKRKKGVTKFPFQPIMKTKQKRRFKSMNLPTRHPQKCSDFPLKRLKKATIHTFLTLLQNIYVITIGFIYIKFVNL